ncbi:Cyclin N-terminal domain-containing protein [Mycena kentingensis (nom. inval.)]|nr:Cyclin N-terminal domain-containing protein [Mycena kentingensis (nom. inval.)]
MQLINTRLTKPIMKYVLASVAETVDFTMGRSHSRGRSAARSSPYLAACTTFATTVLTRTEVTPATVLASLVCITRDCLHLSIALEEYTNDSTLKNVHWALCTGVFGKHDVSRIEREFLAVLNWELGIHEADLLAHHQALAEAAFPFPVRTHKKSMLASLAVPLRHAHQVSATSITLPDLEPSFPASAYSSLGFFAPPMPVHSLAPAVPVASRRAKAEFVDVPMDVEPQHGESFKFLNVLRSFPVPRTHPHARHPTSHTRLSGLCA